jgi:hypothetical protein
MAFNYAEWKWRYCSNITETSAVESSYQATASEDCEELMYTVVTVRGDRRMETTA